jgi:hypothetical protein
MPRDWRRSGGNGLELTGVLGVCILPEACWPGFEVWL